MLQTWLKLNRKDNNQDTYLFKLLYVTTFSFCVSVQYFNLLYINNNACLCNNIRNSFTFSFIFSIYEESLYETYITDIYNIILYIQNPVRFAVIE